VEAQLLRIEQVFAHPNYKKKMYYDDIALLKLEKEVEWVPNKTEVRPLFANTIL